MATLDYEQYLYGLIDLVVKQGASDLNIAVGRPPVLRIDGQLVRTKGDALTPDDLEGIVKMVLNEEDQNVLKKDWSVDAAFSYRGMARFRINAYYKLGNLAIAMRYIPTNSSSIEKLKLPKILHQFAAIRQGLVLAVGPAGHGKTTTIASLIHDINEKRQEHIVSIEDPIEYIYEPVNAVIDQREVGRDVTNFKDGLREALRQDPDVVFVGEIRDLDTVKTTITAAETGHLVLATLNANSASQSVHRIINLFSEGEQAQIRHNLALTLAGVVALRLVPSLRGGRYPVAEILVCTKSVKNLIRTNKVYEIDLVIETNAELGMVSLDRSLVNLVKAGEISQESAREYAIDPVSINNLLSSLK